MMIRIPKVNKVHVTMLPIMFLLLSNQCLPRTLNLGDEIKENGMTFQLDDLAEIGLSQNVLVISMVRLMHPRT
jgi:hypothetical protein